MPIIFLLILIFIVQYGIIVLLNANIRAVKEIILNDYVRHISLHD